MAKVIVFQDPTKEVSSKKGLKNSSNFCIFGFMN